MEATIGVSGQQGSGLRRKCGPSPLETCKRCALYQRRRIGIKGVLPLLEPGSSRCLSRWLV